MNHKNHSPQRHKDTEKSQVLLCASVPLWWLLSLFVSLLLLSAGATHAKTAAAAASNPVAEARLVELSAELRCLVCQNESLASSRAPLAEDLRREVRERIAAGDSNQEIMTYLTDRYGDFVTYRPPFKARTLLLWLLPPTLLIAGLILLLRRIRRRCVTPQHIDTAALAALRNEFEGPEGKPHERS
ncbi:cytochrome c-type biogenesis protein CcmH [Deefgea tanakiae]|uniref:Cytochrome c-type biogenesis protein n=1 Tax=Deefgea tanakiae TaxID=2865840 RepID=A0ABX8Z608_9NEIS|nr:cytochrome c-type biogenesis protein [Deefgea tanakiae]QZA77240.1 cytochrome c-type biogenesis protein CcmH [Deefgea tanakiae]